jgi:hypothetical protein
MDKIWYYKGVNKVKVVMESEGYWIIEALEEFEDTFDDEKVKVKVGEQRIVSSDTVYKRKYLLPQIREHAYELQMEKKLKEVVAEEEKKQE